MHPARKFVIEFLRTIVIDSMSQPVVAKSASAIDIMLEVRLLSAYLLEKLGSFII